MSNPVEIAIVEDDIYYSKVVEKGVRNCLEEAVSEQKLNDNSFNVSVYHKPGDYLSAEKNFSLVILDYHLGGKYDDKEINGESLLATTKELNTNCKVVLLSSQDRLATVAKLKNKGVDFYLMKNANSIERLQEFILNQFN